MFWFIVQINHTWKCISGLPDWSNWICTNIWQRRRYRHRESRAPTCRWIQTSHHSVPTEVNACILQFYYWWTICILDFLKVILLSINMSSIERLLHPHALWTIMAYNGVRPTFTFFAKQYLDCLLVWSYRLLLPADEWGWSWLRNETWDSVSPFATNHLYFRIW